MNSWIIKFEDEVIECYDFRHEAKASLASDAVIDNRGYDVTKKCEILKVEMTQTICRSCRLFKDGCCSIVSDLEKELK